MALVASRLSGSYMRSPAAAWLAPIAARTSAVTRAATSGAGADEPPLVLFTAEQVHASLRMRVGASPAE